MKDFLLTMKDKNYTLDDVIKKIELSIEELQKLESEGVEVENGKTE